MTNLGEATAVAAAPAPCPVCGSTGVRTDAVLRDGVMLLADCPRCEHRWTGSLPLSAWGAPEPAAGGGAQWPEPAERRPARREVASAA